MNLQENNLSMNTEIGSEIHSSINLIQLTKSHDLACLELQKTEPVLRQWIYIQCV